MKFAETKPEFRPLTIALETEEEVQSLLQIVQIIPDDDEFANKLYMELYSRHPSLAFPVRYEGDITILR